MNERELYLKLKPHIARDFRLTTVAQTTVISGGSVATSFSALTGTIANAQAPQFLLRDGSRSLTGSLAVDAGVTIDGVDISAHAADPNAHHAQQHSILGGDHTITGAALTLVGATATNTLGAITPSANPGTTEAVLKATAGLLTLPNFTATTAMTTPLLTATTSVTTPTITTATNVDLLIDPAGTGAVKFPNAQTIRTSTFDSSFPIQGFQINEVTSGLSALTIGKIQADELAVRVFVADEVRVDRGDEYWTKSYGIVSTTFTSPSSVGGTVSVTLEDSPAISGAIFTNSDYVLFRNLEISTGLNLHNIWGQMTSYVNNANGTQSWTFTLRSGATSKEVRKGSLAIDFGSSGAALIHLSVIDSAGAPYIKMRKWVTNPYTPANFTTYLQLGHLGSTGNAYVSPSGFGLYVRSTSAGNRFILADDNGLQIRDASIAMWNGSNNDVLIDQDGVRVRAVALEPLDDINSFRFETASAVTMGGLYGRHYASNYDIFLQSQGDAANDSWTRIQSTGHASNKDANVIISAFDTSTPSKEAAIWLDVDGTSSLIRMIDADAVRFEVPTQSFNDASPYLDLGANLGSAGKRWGVVYADQIIATTVSGASMAGATWQYAGSMVIDANSAGDTVVNVTNSGAGAVVFDVLGTLRQNGANVSLSGHTHDDRYFTETESDARYVQTATLSGYLLASGATTGATSQAQAFTNGVLLNNGSSTTPALAFSGDTTNGIYRISAGVMGIPKALTVGWLKNSLMGFSTQGTADLGMMGFYDRNELINANLRGTVTITFTGAGSVTTNTINNAFNSRGGFLSITGTDATTTQIVIHIDLAATQPNYSAALWQPFLQYRDAWSLTSRSKYKGIVCEVSTDNSTWYKPSGGEWETTDASAAETVPGLWMGTNASPSIPGNVYRYVRFTLTTRQAGASFADQVSISQIGLRHYAAPYSRAWLYTSGDTVYGPLVIKTGSTAALDVQTAAGVSVFTVNTTAATATLAGDLTVDDLAIGNGLVSAPALTFASDTDSGIYRSTANTWHLVANGATVQTVTTAGISVVGALTVPAINTASGTLTIAPANSTTAVTGSLSLTGTLSGTSWNVTSGGAATLVTVAASTSVTTPSITTASGNLALTSVGGTVAVAGALTGTSTATFATSVVAPLHTAASGNLTVSAPATLLLNAATANTVDLQINSVSQWSASDSRLNPRGSVLVDIGDYNRKVRTLFAAELYVETLVAQNVLATIGGRVMVAPTTKLIADLSTSAPIPLWTNLTSWWTLDEASGNRSDSKGSNTLTDTNTVMSVGGKKSAAGMFVKANSERLTIADNASLSVGDIDFYIAAWVYPTLDDGASQHTIASKAAGSGNRAWYLYIDWSANQAKFRVFDSTDASTTVTASTFGNLSINTWYFIEGWHDSVNNQITISVNGTSTTASHTTGSRDDSGPFQLGAANGASLFDGYIDEALFAKYIPTSAERAYLYNSGTGRSYSEVAAVHTIDVEHNQLASGDYIYMQTAPGGVAQIEAMQVISAAVAITGGYRYWVYRNLDGTGINSWVTGDAVVNLGGAAGEGYLELTATSTIHNHLGPTTTYYVRTGTAAWNDVKPVVTQGNLRSFVDYTGDEFGTAAGNDLTLTPATGFQGYALDRVNGLRLFNVDFRLYESATKRMEIVPSTGLNLLADTSTTNLRQIINWYRDLDSKSATPAASLLCYTFGVTNNINLLVNRDGANYGASMLLGTPTSYITLTEVNSTTSTGELYAGSWLVTGNVGFGTAATATMKLEINGHARIASGSSLYLGGKADASESGWRLTYSSGAFFDVTDGDVVFRADSTTGGTERMRINYSTGAVTFANSVGTDWTNLSYASGWGDYGSGFTPGQYKKVGDLVFLRGLVARSSGASLNIATLPAGYRPQYRYLFGVHTNSGGGGDRVDILTSGNIDLQTGGVTYVQLDGLVFSTLN